jgi:hypothetical protein
MRRCAGSFLTIRCTISSRSVSPAPSLPADDLKSFVTYAEANRARMTYGNAGLGSISHYACVILLSALKQNITHVPCRAGNERPLGRPYRLHVRSDRDRAGAKSPAEKSKPSRR